MSGAHPAPSTMAREAYPDAPAWEPRAEDEVHDARIHYAAGIAAERSRMVAWLESKPSRALLNPHDLAAALEGK